MGIAIRRRLAALLLAALPLAGCDVALIAYFATKDDDSKKTAAAPDLSYRVYVRNLGAGDLDVEKGLLDGQTTPPAPWVFVTSSSSTVELDLTAFSADAVLLWNLERQIYRVDAVEEITADGSTLRTAADAGIREDNMDNKDRAGGYPNGVTSDLTAAPTGVAYLFAKFSSNVGSVRISAYVAPGAGDVMWVNTQNLGGDQTAGGAAVNSAGVFHGGFTNPTSDGSAWIIRHQADGTSSGANVLMVSPGTATPGSIALAIVPGTDDVWVASKERVGAVTGGIRVRRFLPDLTGLSPVPGPATTAFGSDPDDVVDHNGLALDSTNNAYVACGIDTGNLNHFLQRVTPSGVVWTFPPAPPVDTNATYWFAVDASTNSHVFVAGDLTTNAVGPVIQGYLARFDAADGAAGWTQSDGTPDTSPDRMRAIVSDGAGNLWVGGGHDTGGNRDGVILRYPAALAAVAPGTPLTVEDHEGPGAGDDEILDLARDADGTLYACGYETASGSNVNLWVRKYDPAGAVVWTRTFDGSASGADRAVSLALTATHVYVFGEESTGANGRDPHVRKYVK